MAIADNHTSDECTDPHCHKHVPPLSKTWQPRGEFVSNGQSPSDSRQSSKHPHVPCALKGCKDLDIVRVRGYCETHYKEQVLSSLAKERDQAYNTYSQLCTIYINAEFEVSIARVAVGKSVGFRCSKCGKLFPDGKTLDIHDTFCYVQPKKVSKPRQPAAPKAVAPGLTIDDLE